MRRYLTWTALLLAAPAGLAQPNVLLVLMDDAGRDLVTQVHTPNLDALASAGMTLDTFWSSPSCSPTRAGILQGQWPKHTGLGVPVPHLVENGPGGLWNPPVPEHTLPALLDGRAATAIIGKWHLVQDEPYAGIPLVEQSMNPVLWGFDRHSGPLAGGLFEDWCPGPDSSVWCGWSYEGWQQNEALRVRSEVFDVTDDYATTRQVDDTLAFIQAQSGAWFVMLAFNAPHTPAHLPPTELLTSPPPYPPGGDKPRLVRLMLEALDTEFGRLMQSIDLADTYVFVMGDNGTVASVQVPPDDGTNAKGTVNEGGVHVPAFVAGPRIPTGSVTSSPIASIDLWATVLELMGVTPPSGTDSVSFVPVLRDPAARTREVVFAERFAPNGDVTRATERNVSVRDDRWFLSYDVRQTAFALYDLLDDPGQQHELLAAPPLAPEAQRACLRLGRQLGRYLGQSLPPAL